ncbi:MAG TPA: hypothetical protein VFH06_04335 [Candidatus Saccharimonadales bacterium]|nr:hypothetical protein [Candidatus Saccharimonadales bacterium]
MTTSHSRERQLSPAQDYLAVPLDLPISDPQERVEYNRDSLVRIQKTLAAAVDRAMSLGWIEDTESDTEANGGKGLTQRVSGLMDLSLTQSHVTRLFLNRHFDEIFNSTTDDPRIIKAAKGTAEPVDLMELLVEYPELYSVELAKLSHPLNGAATTEMDKEVKKAILSQGGELVTVSPKFKPKTRELSIPAMTVLRKRKVGRVATQAGEISIVSRQAFLVRGDAAARQEVPYIDRKIKNEDRFDELKKLVEMELPELTEPATVKWVQPIATSYYAKYLDPKKEA